MPVHRLCLCGDFFGRLRRRLRNLRIVCRLRILRIILILCAGNVPRNRHDLILILCAQNVPRNDHGLRRLRGLREEL